MGDLLSEAFGPGALSDAELLAIARRHGGATDCGIEPFLTAVATARLRTASSSPVRVTRTTWPSLTEAEVRRVCTARS